MTISDISVTRARAGDHGGEVRLCGAENLAKLDQEQDKELAQS